MLLREELEYVVVDVETTGLDKKHDDIIQIGLIHYNAHGGQIRSFSSYIKPENIGSIHDIVNMITGISIDDLEHAPKRSDIAEEVSSFFTSSTVIIGHSVGFDIAFLERLLPIPHHAIIDTLPLSQSLLPFSHSYALEIIAKNILPHPQQTGYHDALVDCMVTGEVFFVLIKKCESMFYQFPYLREISKRCHAGLAHCIHIGDEGRFLLHDVPQLDHSSTYSTAKPVAEPLPVGTWFVGNTKLTEIVKHTPLQSYTLCASHPQKLMLLQKSCHTMGMPASMYDHMYFDHDLLHRYFTQSHIASEDWYCILKYICHCLQGHSAYHILNRYDARFVQMLRDYNHHPHVKKLYSHTMVFEAIEEGRIPPDEHIVLFDKERLFANRQKRKFSPLDMYRFIDTIDALVYKYKLLGRDTLPLQCLYACACIFTGVRSGCARQYTLDSGNEVVEIDDLFSNTYFSRCTFLRENIQHHIDACRIVLDSIDIIMLDKIHAALSKIRENPLKLTRKRAQYDERYTIQPLDMYTTRDDIQSHFRDYHVSYLSVLDNSLPAPSGRDTTYTPLTLTKRKDIIVGDTPRLFIIAPSKKASQDLLLSLHKSKVYQDTFLAAENVTGGAGKILQQVNSKSTYILMGGYGMCLQAVAQGVHFDVISALDILKHDGIVNFTDIGYYAGQQ